MDNYIELKDVTFYYGTGQKKNIILDNVSCRFEAAKVYAITGKSGIGKSTTISLLGGMEEPQEGRIVFNGSDIRDMKKYIYQRENMGVIFQNYNLLEYLTVCQNVKIAMDIKGIERDVQEGRIKELLEKVGLDESLKHRKVNDLSGGEQQRVAIARALSGEADILLADEPTGNLDEDTARDIIELLISIAHNEDKCVVIVTHSQFVAQCADQVLRLEGQKLFSV